MLEKTVYLIFAGNIILLVGLVIGIRGWQKDHGKISEKKLALILTSYFSFSSITTLLPLMKTNARATIMVDATFLLVFWGIGYPWIRWLYRKMASWKRC